jgi:hypothetical protein
MPGAAWCDITVCCAGEDAGGRDIIGWFAYTPSHAKWFDAQHLFFVGTKGIRANDIAFFHFGNPNYGGRWHGIHHVGVVTGTHKDGRVATIEGNTSDDCLPRLRSRSLIAGYARPRYTQLPAAGTTTPSTPAPPAKKAPRIVPPTLALNSQKHWWVKHLQQTLNSLMDGTDLVVDGDFGAKTHARVEKWQKYTRRRDPKGRKLTVDGSVGPNTWYTLGH